MSDLKRMCGNAWKWARGSCCGCCGRKLWRGQPHTDWCVWRKADRDSFRSLSRPKRRRVRR